MDALAAALQQCQHDARLLALGEIGLDFFLPELKTPAMRQQQTACYRAQIRLAQQYRLPVLLHVRQSVDAVLKELRAAGLLDNRPAPGLAMPGEEDEAASGQSELFEE